MLLTPSRGVGTTTARCRRDAFADWIEANLLFGRGHVLHSSVVDAVAEAVPRATSDDIDVFVADVLRETRSRSEVLGQSSAYSFGRGEILVERPWNEVLPLSFLLMISCTHWFPAFREAARIQYGVQGELFERLVEESLRAQFPMWSVYRTGWSSATTATLAALIVDIAKEVKENVGNYRADDVQPTDKDAGLDLVLHQPYNDGRAGPPVFLIQCASGSNWITKLNRPSIARWQNLVSFSVEPQRGFALPFDLSDQDFRSTTFDVVGPVFDRRRLLDPLRHSGAWLSNALERELFTFVEPLVGVLTSTLAND